MIARLMLIALTSLVVEACEPSKSRDQEPATVQTVIAAECFAAHNLWIEFKNQNPPPVPPPVVPPVSINDKEMNFARASWELERVHRSPDKDAERYIIEFSGQLIRQPARARQVIARCTAMEDADTSFRRSIPRLKDDFHLPPQPPPTY